MEKGGDKERTEGDIKNVSQTGKEIRLLVRTIT